MFTKADKTIISYYNSNIKYLVSMFTKKDKTIISYNYTNSKYLAC